MILSNPFDLNTLPRADVTSPAFWEWMANELPKVVPNCPDLQSEEGQARLEAAFHFSTADLEVGRRAGWLASRPAQAHSESVNDHVWYVEQYEDSYFYDGLQHALAVELQDCLQAGWYPRIEASPDCVVINPQASNPLVLRRMLPLGSGAGSSRAAGAITGLVERDNANEELAKRIARFPGWADRKLQVESSRRGHLPLLKEWRTAARLLLVGLGLEEPSPQQIEDVVCFFMCSPSWHHLTAHMKAAEAGHRGSTLWWIFHSKGDRQLYAKRHGCPAAALDRLIAATHAMGTLEDDWQDLVLTAGIEDDMDSIMLAPKGAGRGSSWLMDRMWLRQACVTPALHAHVASFFDGRSLEAATLEEMFLTHLSPRERTERADKLLQVTQLTQAASRRVCIGDDEDGEYIRLDAVTASGETSCVMTIPREHLALVFDERVGRHAVVAGPDLYVRATLSADATEVLSSLRSQVLGATQARADARFAAMSQGDRIEWRSKLRTVAHREAARFPDDRMA